MCGKYYTYWISYILDVNAIVFRFNQGEHKRRFFYHEIPKNKISMIIVLGSAG
jgi:hypothetical protein